MANQQLIVINLENLVWECIKPLCVDLQPNERPKVYFDHNTETMKIVFLKSKHFKRCGTSFIQRSISSVLICAIHSLGHNLGEVHMGYMKGGDFIRMSKCRESWPELKHWRYE